MKEINTAGLIGLLVAVLDELDRRAPKNDVFNDGKWVSAYWGEFTHDEKGWHFTYYDEESAKLAHQTNR